MITNISIRNFRSLVSEEISANWMTVLVGANDAGKSNVLRAINLFFNGETDAGVMFNFERDFNQFAINRQKKAREIEITIRFKLPTSYCRKDFPKEIEWKKTWRQDVDGPHTSVRTYYKGPALAPRSKIPTLLDRIKFTYIPAIKDHAFFADLQGRLYDVLSSVAAHPLRESAKIFEEQLQTQLNELLVSIQEAFSAETSMRLPDSLRQIFENLEFNSGGVPLSRRGDGIKIRHIPMMLRFMAEKQDQILNKGGIKYTHIWGFEEPENSVEMSACFKMADDLMRVIEDHSNHQLFLTTHSPIFYRIQDKGGPDTPWVNTLFVEKTQDRTQITVRRYEEVDESMGLMPLVAPFVSQAKEKHDLIHQELRVAREIAQKKKPTILVEGASDRRILIKAFSLFFPEKLDNLHIYDPTLAYGSANALASRSLAWLLEMRHRAIEKRPPIIAIFDNDKEGRQAQNNLKQDIQKLKINNRELCIFTLPPQNGF